MLCICSGEIHDQLLEQESKGKKTDCSKMKCFTFDTFNQLINKPFFFRVMLFIISNEIVVDEPSKNSHKALAKGIWLCWVK